MFNLLILAIEICAILYVATEIFARLLQKPYAQWVRTRLRPILIAPVMIGLTIPSLWVMYLLIVALVPMMARTRSQIAPVYLVTVMAVPPLSSILTIGPLYLFPVNRYVFAGIGALIAYLIRPKGRALPRAGIDLPIIIIAVLEAMAGRDTAFTNILRVDAALLTAFVLPYVVLSRSFRESDDAKRLMIAMALCGFALSCVGVYEAKRTVLPYEVLQSHVGASSFTAIYQHQRAGMLRSGVSFVEPTSFSLFLSLCVLALLPIRDVFRSKRAWLLVFGGFFMGLYVANSRAGILALVLGILSYDLYRARFGQLAAKVAAIAALGLAAVTAAGLSPEFADRIGLAGSSVGTADYRKLLLTRGWEEISKHPWTGVPNAQIFASLADLRQGEGFVDFVNAYIWYGMSAGLIGMGAFLLMFFVPPLRALLNRRRLRKLPGGLELAGAVFAAGLQSAVAAGTSGFDPHNALILFMMFAALARMCGMRRPASEAPLPEEEPPSPVEHRHTLAPA